MRKLILAVSMAIAMLPLAMATGEEITPNKESSPDIDGPLVVYSGRSAGSIDPILHQFERDTGIQLDIRHNSSAPFATLVLQEQEYTPADVLFFSESGYLGLLANAGLLAPISDNLIEQVDPRFVDSEGNWIGISGRMRVVAYDPDKITPDEIPDKIQGLTDSKYKDQVGLAYDNQSFQAQVSALRHLWGEEPALEWLEGLKANNSQNYATSPQVLMAVANGEVLLGITNHYYLYRFKDADPDLNVDNYIFPAEGRDGNLMVVSGMAITKSSQRKQQAQQLIDYLLSERSQAYMRCQIFEFQSRKDYFIDNQTCLDFGYTTPKNGQDISVLLPDINTTELADVNQADLADVTQTIIDLQQLGLL